LEITVAIKKIDFFRDSGTGKFVTEKYADSHKRTTEHEVRKVVVQTPKSTDTKKK